jgi:tetratricopeptide (TPR) repeat protein
MKLRAGFILVVLVYAWAGMIPAANTDTTLLEDALFKLYAGRFPEAADLYQQIVDKNPASSGPYYGLVRSLLGAHRSQDAYAVAKKAQANAPDTAPVETAVGLVSYRQGDLIEAERHFRAALKIDSQYPGALQGLASIYSAVSRFKSASHLLNAAYLRAPADPVLALAHANSLAGDDHISALEKVLAGLDPTSDAAVALRAHIANDRAVGDKKIRRLASPYEAYNISLLVIQNEPHRRRGLGVQVKFNQKHSAKLLLDTGASGIAVSTKFAEHAGLEKLGGGGVAHGIGDRKAEASFRYLAAEISAGKVVFERYPISAFKSAKDQDADGLIGADVFSRFLVAIDFESLEMTLTPRATQPGDSGDDHSDDADTMPAGFHRVYRFGNHLAVPTTINEKETKLFLIDSGSTVNIIDEQVARDVTKVHKDSGSALRGIQGKVDGVSRADDVMLVFAGFRQMNPDLMTINLESMSDSMGVGFGGILGMPVLANLKLSIDYANGAVKMDYLHPGR